MKCPIHASNTITGPSRPRLIVTILLALSIARPLLGDVSCVSPDLPRTDGQGLAAPPIRIGGEERQRLIDTSRQACEGPCITPFGQVLGIADRAEARSNCTSRCVHPAFNFLDLETGAVSVSSQPSPEGTRQYLGITYQCVAYARYWWMKNLNLTFGDVDNAHQILYLTEGIDARTGTRIPLGRSVNGSARRPPQRGDLVVYASDRSDPEWYSGHVAVVVDVDRERGLVTLAEQNYDNRPWQDPGKFARRIPLFDIDGHFTLLDVPDSSRRNPQGGRIIGWVYPTHYPPPVERSGE